MKLHVGLWEGVSNIPSTLSKRFLDFDLVNRSVRVILLVLQFKII